MKKAARDELLEALELLSALRPFAPLDTKNGPMKRAYEFAYDIAEDKAQLWIESLNRKLKKRF